MSQEPPRPRTGFELDFRQLVDLTEGVQRLVRTRLWARILVGMGAGIGCGLLLSPTGGALVSDATAGILAGWFALPGQIFLALIQMVVIPLVLASIILGVTSSGDPKQLGRVGLRVGLFFLITTAVPTAIGIFIALSIQPGAYLDREVVQATLGPAQTASAPAVPDGVDISNLPDRIVALIPSDPARAALERSMLRIVLFAILVGVALVSIERSRARPLLELSGSLQEVSMKVVSWAMLLAPYAVFGLLAQISIRIGLSAILGLSVYLGTVLGGLILVGVVYLLIVWIGGRVSPLRFLRATRCGHSGHDSAGHGYSAPGGVALIIGVDRILDMSRATINVTGDLVACVVLNRWQSNAPPVRSRSL